MARDVTSVISRTDLLIERLFKGIDNDNIYLIIGASGLGKTSLVLCQIPSFLYVMLKSRGELTGDSKFILVNTDMSFKEKRLRDVCECFGVNYEEFKKHLMIHNLMSQNEQHSFIMNALPKIVEANRDNIKYIAIDPINHHIRQEFAKADANYRLNVAGRTMPQLEAEMNVLKELNVKYRIPIFITCLPKKRSANQIPIRWQTEMFAPLEVPHLSDVAVWLAQDEHNVNRVLAKRLKHRTEELSETFTLIKCREGLIVEH